MITGQTFDDLIEVFTQGSKIGYEAGMKDRDAFAIAFLKFYMKDDPPEAIAHYPVLLNEFKKTL